MTGKPPWMGASFLWLGKFNGARLWTTLCPPSPPFLWVLGGLSLTMSTLFPPFTPFLWVLGGPSLTMRTLFPPFTPFARALGGPSLTDTPLLPPSVSNWRNYQNIHLLSFDCSVKLSYSRLDLTIRIQIA